MQVRWAAPTPTWVRTSPGAPENLGDIVALIGPPPFEEERRLSQLPKMLRAEAAHDGVSFQACGRGDAPGRYVQSSDDAARSYWLLVFDRCPFKGRPESGQHQRPPLVLGLFESVAHHSQARPCAYPLSGPALSARGPSLNVGLHRRRRKCVSLDLGSNYAVQFDAIHDGDDRLAGAMFNRDVGGGCSRRRSAWTTPTRPRCGTFSCRLFEPTHLKSSPSRCPCCRSRAPA